MKPLAHRYRRIQAIQHKIIELNKHRNILSENIKRKLEKLVEQANKLNSKDPRVEKKLANLENELYRLEHQARYELDPIKQLYNKIEKTLESLKYNQDFSILPIDITSLTKEQAEYLLQNFEKIELFIKNTLGDYKNKDGVQPQIIVSYKSGFKIHITIYQNRSNDKNPFYVPIYHKSKKIEI